MGGIYPTLPAGALAPALPELAKLPADGPAREGGLEVVTLICEHLQTLRPSQVPYGAQVQFVKDRPGHDRRYAMNITRIRQELGWTPKETFKTGIQKTIEWYLANPQWVADVTSGSYRDWIKVQYQSAP